MSESANHEQADNEADWRGIPDRALRTRRGAFLAEADRLFPWASWADLIEPHYPKRGNGRPPYPLAPMLRLYMLAQWYGLSDLAAQEMATDSVAVRHFMGLPLTWDKGAPDESTFASFRRLLARRGLAVELATDTNEALARQGWKIRPGDATEAAIMAGPCEASKARVMQTVV
jgi:IS5 family transposase